jgi:Caulimovirus viroplasmin
VQDYYPVSISGSERHYSTSVYPLLAEFHMVEYFGMEHGVSKRPPEGTPHLLVSVVPPPNSQATDIREMLRVIKSNRFWLGDIHYVDTATVDDTQQEIHKPAVNTVSRRWYCVFQGTAVGIFNSWYGHLLYLRVILYLFLFRAFAAPYVQGVSNAAHRSWDTKEEAYSSFQYALILGSVKLLPSPPPGLKALKPCA